MTLTAPAPTTRRLTRDDVLRLGQSARPWEFLPVALRALKAAPQDAAVRLLAAAHFARLGLRTPAAEALDRLPPGAADEPAVASLRRAVEGLPDDRIPVAESLAMARRNLEALGAAADRIAEHLDAWVVDRERWDWFRAVDGNIVRRRAGSWEPADWRALGDHRGAAARFAEAHLPPARAMENAYTLEGIDPPWLALLVAERTPREESGFQPHLDIVQADPMELLDGLAQADLAAALRSERVRLFWGPQAPARLAADLASRLETQIRGAYIPLRSLRTRAEPPVERVRREAEAAQLAEHRRLEARIAETYAGRDRAWWERRYAEALAGGPPLRVLVPTCRYTTYVRHAAADLAQAFRALGCEARVLIEPDGSSRHASVAYLRALAECEPDLVVLINYTRASLGPWWPPLPFACWIQDAMPHQFDAAAGAAQGPLDFIVGHVHAELAERFGYPRERALPFPVVASGRKFHDGPVDASARRRFECEVALVSHHGETPEAMHARLVAEAGPNPRTRDLLEALRPRVEEVARDPLTASPMRWLEDACARTAREAFGAEPDARLLAMLYRHYALPLADRILRHETVEWAADVAERRGWRLRLHGRGWERHERFARFAAGPIEHGEDLRACYQAAAAHLHASINTLVHQRVMECALSGGLPLCRLTAAAAGAAYLRVRDSLRAAGPPTVCSTEHRLEGWIAADHPGAMALAALRQRIGLPPHEFIWDTPTASAAEENDAAWLLGDLGEVGFGSREAMEARLERAIERPAWRRAMSGWIARRVRERLTHEALGRRMLDLVRAGLASESPVS